MRIDILLNLAGFVLCLGAIISHWRFHRAIRPLPERPEKPRDRYPSISVIRPVRGRDVGEAENLAAALDTGYPGDVETIFVFDDESDEGLPLARAAIAEHERLARPGRATIVFCGRPPRARTGKVHAMIVGMEHAKGELVGFGDSDTRPDHVLLRLLVDAILDDPRAGSAFAPVVVVGPARTLGDAEYQLLINSLYGPAVARLAGHSDVPFIMGQLMVFRREALDAIGGIACAEGQLVDDMYLGTQLTRAGWRNAFVPHALPIITGGMRFPEFMETVRRWMLLSRSGLPSSFARPLWVRGIEFWLGLVLTIFAVAIGHPIGAIGPIASVFVLSLSLDSLQHEFGGARFGLKLGWSSFLLFIMVPPIYFATRRHREVSWRGRAYPVSEARRLERTADSHEKPRHA